MRYFTIFTVFFQSIFQYKIVRVGATIILHTVLCIYFYALANAEDMQPHVFICSHVPQCFFLWERKEEERERDTHTSHCSPTHLQVEKQHWLSALSYVVLQTSLWSEHIERCMYYRLCFRIRVGVYSVTRVFLPWKQFIWFKWCCSSNNATAPLNNRELFPITMTHWALNYATRLFPKVFQGRSIKSRQKKAGINGISYMKSIYVKHMGRVLRFAHC